MAQDRLRCVERVSPLSCGYPAKQNEVMTKGHFLSILKEQPSRLLYLRMSLRAVGGQICISCTS